MCSGDAGVPLYIVHLSARTPIPNGKLAASGGGRFIQRARTGELLR